MRKASLTSRKLTKIIADLASNKKAEEIKILDMRKIVNFCDFFVICSGGTDRHVHAIADNVKEGLQQIGIKIAFKKNSGNCDWVVLDSGDVVTHVFQKQTREFYQLEDLWSEAKEVVWEE